MKFLIIDTYYERFSHGLYEKNLALASQAYQKQLQFFLNQCFGASDFFSTHLQQLGHEAKEIIANCDVLQQQWAREYAPHLAINSSSKQSYAWQHAVLQAQIEQFKPEILYVHDINWAQGSLLRAIRPHVQLIIGQNACPLHPQIDYGAYDLLLTSFPHYVEYFRHQGVKSEYFRLAFEPRVLNYLNRTQTSLYQVGFIGGFSVLHRHGHAVLEQVAQALPLDVWGYGLEDLPQEAPLRQRYHGEAWGIEMFRQLAACKIALNRHIDVAEAYANNMRLYEATGVGTCLVTDMKKNLHELFEPDREIVTYRTPAECVEKIKYLLTHETQRAEIAKAGQARTLREHCYIHRIQELEEIIHRYLPLATSKKKKGDFVPMQPETPYSFPQAISKNQATHSLLGKNILFYTDESEDTQHHDAILRELITSGYRVTCIQPKASSHQIEHVQYRVLGFDPVEEFERTMTHLEDAQQVLSNIQPTLIIFSDACPFSNLAVKKVAAQLNIPYLILVNLVAYELAELYATHLEELTQSYEHAQAVMALSPEDLHTLRQYFRLPPHQGRIIGESHLGQEPPKEPKNIPTIQPFKKEEQQTISVQVPPPSHRPHWEYLPQGWATQDSRIQGWNVQSILNTQRAKWSAFAAALQGTGPLGISHEAPNISNNDYSSHNTVMAFAYVLALAARKKERISILDWGGGLGHYYLLSQALLPEVKMDYYCKEVPVLCQGGREVLPQVTFFEDEQACFNRRYDLVLCSSSLQYSQEWKRTLQQLVSTTHSYLYITRLPIVHHAPSFVVVQRPYQYGYHTEYKTWFLNRQEFLNYAAQLPIKLVREFLIIERFPVHGAPEEGEARGFLFKV